MPVRACELPDDALLRAYVREGVHTDCYAVDIPARATQRAFVEAFYTSPVFRLERWVLAVFAARPSSDDQARRLAVGEADGFAAWRVEARETDQLLLSDDVTGRTRSWLMRAPLPGGDATRLFFGSAVVPAVDARTGRAGMGAGFTGLLGFHRRYSRVLLGAAARRLFRAGVPNR